MSVVAAGPIARRTADYGAVAAAAAIGAYAVGSPNGEALYLMLIAMIALAIATALPPELFIAVTLVSIGVTTSLASPVAHMGPAAVYSSDVVAVVVAIRGLAPRDRRPPAHALSGLPLVAFGIWAVIMALVGLRGLLSGIPVRSVVRGDMAIAYYPLVYFGLMRVLRERRVDVHRLAKMLVVVALGFVVYMLVCRALNRPFHDAGIGGVPSGELLGEEVRRNYGFASAFTLYPIITLVGVAGMAFGRANRLPWTLLAFVGIVATLTTLLRGAIFGMVLGLVIILWLRPRHGAYSRRVLTAVRIAFATLSATVVVLAVSPRLGDAIIQRALPFTQQAQGATANADYRYEANQTGLRSARAHPLGIGVVDVTSLNERSIDTGYIVHSGAAYLLVFGGWPALIAAIVTIVAVVRRSAEHPASASWIHPAFVGTMAMFAFYSLTSSGLAGEAWVIQLAALVVALRFGVSAGSHNSRDRS